jgi:hypothetical protein
VIAHVGSASKSLIRAFEAQLDGGAFGVSCLGDDHFGQSRLGGLVVVVRAVAQQDGVGVLFKRTGVPEV